ncbi:MAG: hydrogenase nickel incorporation protein HypA [Ignisphaera sp.]|nr:hydrogenase nickel incorporation protein HypA [Ignisphaera sp.]
MHELALAQAVVMTLVEEASKRALNNINAEVVVGELQSIDMEIFESNLNELKELVYQERKIKINIRIVREEARFKCNRCGYIWRLSDLSVAEDAKEAIHFIPEAAHSYIQCPRCGSRDFEIISGRGVYVRLI